MNPYELPEDFEAFWTATVQDALSSPLDIQRSFRSEKNSLGFLVDEFSFRSISGSKLNGWIAFPEGAKNLPGFVWVPPYGRESVLPNQYGTREGFVSLSFNFHGESAFHQEKYAIPRGYFSEGAEEPESWIFRRMFQDTILATRVLQNLLEVDEQRLGMMGMSQGAGLSLWNAAWNPLIKAVCADMPFLGNIGSTLLNTVYRYPLKELRDFMDSIPIGEARVLNTLSYFDTVFQARFSKVPVHVSLGLKDPATRPDTVRSIFNSLTSPKDLVELDWGHDWHPSMVENNRNWLNRYL